MPRCVVVLALAVACMCSVAAAQELQTSSSNTRKLLSTLQPPQKAPTAPPRTSGGPSTCCSCKCVIPGKDLRSPECKATPGCVGMGAPSYGQKNICADGANRKCEDVCMWNMGSWKAYHEC